MKSPHVVKLNEIQFTGTPFTSGSRKWSPSLQLQFCAHLLLLWYVATSFACCRMKSDDPLHSGTRQFFEFQANIPPSWTLHTNEPASRIYYRAKQHLNTTSKAASCLSRGHCNATPDKAYPTFKYCTQDSR
jgi:hypothetical protein